MTRGELGWLIVRTFFEDSQDVRSAAYTGVFIMAEPPVLP